MQDTEGAYRALDASIRQRAQQMVARPDVKGLLRLRDEIARRDKALGSREPQLVNDLLAELQRYTDQARALQLQKDRQAFEAGK